MVTEIIETGRTVDEAIRSACHKLGHDLESCDFEIIDFPKKGFLGLKNIPAKVRVYLKEEVVRAKEKAASQAVQQAEAKRAEPQPRPEGRERRKPRQAPSVRAKEQKPVKERQPEAKAVEVRSSDEKILIGEGVITPEMMEKAAAATAYLEGIFQHLNLSEGSIQPIWEEGGVCLSVQGSSLGAIIGRRGETLDALQYLSGLVANRMEGDYLRITVDCGDYRVKRKTTLEALAHRVSEQVLKTDISKTLEPMNPFERRIIHATVSTIEGVSSTSVGEEPNRRVVITTPTAKSSRRGGKSSSGRSDRGERLERRGGRGRDRDRDRGGDRRSSGSGGGKGVREQRKPAAYQQPARDLSSPPSEAADQPLYGKIDLE